MREIAEVVRSGPDGPEFPERLDLTALRIEVVRLQPCLERSTNRWPVVDRGSVPLSGVHEVVSLSGCLSCGAAGSSGTYGAMTSLGG